jgi:predicted ATPase
VARLLGLRIKNYRALADVSIGQVSSTAGEQLPGLCAFIGPNGSGKSTLLDALGFVADCLAEGVEGACDKPHRGGFQRLRTQGRSGPIEFQLYYRETDDARPIDFSFAVDEERGVPIVAREELLQARKGVKRGKLYAFLKLKRGQGHVWSGDSTEGEQAGRQGVRLADLSRLGITTLGNLKEHQRIVKLLDYISGWYLSYFVPDAARQLPPAGAQKHLDREGRNVGNVLQYLERTHPDRVRGVLDRIARAIPGLQRIETEESQDRRLLLRFAERGYVDPFYQQSMSDGTLKMFAYLLLLNDPEPQPFIGIEEPENGLYHKLLEDLAKEFKRHTQRARTRTQVLVTTHSPYFVDSLQPEDVWLLRKSSDGSTSATRAADLPQVRQLVQEGLPLGSLWYSNHLDATPAE